MSGSRFLIAAAAAVLLAGVAAFASETKHWTYGGETGPERWGELAVEYALCGTGRMQSPIDLVANAQGAVAVALNYKPVPLTVLNNGHTVQFNVANGGKLEAAGIDHELLQVHFHAPSEHTLGGKAFPAEAHFVHKAADGALAVVGVLIVEGEEHRALAPLFAHLPEHRADPKTHAGVTIDLAAVLPKSRELYRYMGSLTTPPCSEGVHWHVLKEPVALSKAQIERLSRAMGHTNARPVQQPFSRLVVAPGS